jgi:DNA repair protein RecO (recombination protein O)
VLRGRNLGEADRILTLFTLEHGKLDAVAKGARRGRSRLGGRLEFGNEVLLTLHRGRSLDVIAGAEIVREHWRALVVPERFTVASAAGEMIDALCEPDLAMAELYALLVDMLAAVAASNAPQFLLTRFSLRMLEMLGLAPPLDACIQCGEPLGEAAWVDVKGGGFVDRACREPGYAILELDANDLRSLRERVRPTQRAAEAVTLLVAHHLGRRPKTEAALAEMRQ